MVLNTDDDMDTKLTIKDNIKVQTYVFDNRGKTTGKQRKKINYYQLIPSSLAYLESFSFGIMVGWSSPIYPQLLHEGADIRINMDETALIAGFLMIGNMFGVLPAHFMSFTTKHGLITGLILMPIGWFIMWQSGNIFALLASRFLIGFGHGLGSHHAKEYIKEMSDSPFKDVLVKSSGIYTGFGVLLGYFYGAYVDFRIYSLISFFVTFATCVLCVFLPQSPLELVKTNKIAQAKLLLEYLRPEVDANEEINKLKWNMENEITNYAFEIFKCKVFRNKFMVLMVLVFFQLTTGVQTTIIFCMVLLNKFSIPNTEILAIFYIIITIITQIITTFHLYRFNTKYILLLSSTFTSVFLIANSVVLYYNINQKWDYLPYFLLICFNISSNIGLFPLPFLLTSKLFPKSPFVGHIQNIFFSICLIIVTKLFQMLISYQELYTAFLFFGVPAVLATVFVSIFVPNDVTKLYISNNEKSSIDNFKDLNEISL